MSLAPQSPLEEALPERAESDAVVDVVIERAEAPATPAVPPRIVALLNQKGGVGKTTSTVNLGAALARLGQRVLLVDLDPQSNLSLHFGVEPVEGQPTVHELLTDDAVRVEDTTVTARPGLDFVPAVTELALVEGELAERPDMQHALRRKLEPAYSRYDVILLDCPPSLGVLSVNALTVADDVLVPMQAHYLPLRGLEKLLQTVHMVSEGLNPRIRVAGVLLCMHEGNSGHARAVIADIEAQLAQFRDTDLPWAGARVVQPPVRRNIKLAEAPSFGKTIFDYAPSCPGAHDYRRIAESLLESWGRPVPAFEGARRARSGESADPSEAAPIARRAKSARPKRAASVARRAKGARAADAKPAAKGARKPRPHKGAAPRARNAASVARTVGKRRKPATAAKAASAARVSPSRATGLKKAARRSTVTARAKGAARKAGSSAASRRETASKRRKSASRSGRMRSGGLSL